MQSERLRASLEELRSEINAADLADGPAKERLNRLITAIELRLEEPDNEEHHASLVESVRDSIDRLKVEHPRATAILNRIMNSLGGVGI